MPRIGKFEETCYEKIQFSGKIFMYSSLSWNVLFPIVDIIRLLKKNTIISYKYGKGQQIIKNYSTQYNHRVLGCDFKNKKDYLSSLKTVKNIFVFTDEDDIFITNLINTAKVNKINIICYSNLDAVYHFYDYSISGKTTVLKTPEEVINFMYDLLDLNDVKKIAELFPDFEIIESDPDTKKSSLDECIELLKKVEIEEKKKKKEFDINKIYFDPASSKLKSIEYHRSQKNRNFEEQIPERISQEQKEKNNSFIRSFFKSKV